jgi:hypothetical protein
MMAKELDGMIWGLYEGRTTSWQVTDKQNAGEGEGRRLPRKLLSFWIDSPRKIWRPSEPSWQASSWIRECVTR